MVVRVFVAYSHSDKKYLADDSLLGHLRGLEHEGVAEFWYDERITTGDLWDDQIRQGIAESQIALVLVSELFLTSPYVNRVEISSFLKKRKDEGMVIFPVILSACDWESHEWLARTQFLPGGRKNIESDFTDPGKQKELFIQIKRDLRQQIHRISKKRDTPTSSVVDKTRVMEKKVTDTVPSEGWKNPFTLVTANDLPYEDIPQLFVGEYTDFDTIGKHFDTVLEGQRGTGKTMILRYMAFETQIRVWTDTKKRDASDFFRDPTNFVGVYCRLDQGTFDRSDLDAVDSGDRKDCMFEHRFSLYCLSHLLKTLDSVLKSASITNQGIQRLKQRLSLLLQEPQINECLDWPETYYYVQETINRQVAEVDIHLGSILPGGSPTKFNPWLTMDNQIVPLLQLLQETLELKCSFFLLLDDFDVLSSQQQSCVFRTASARKLGLVCFKYGIMSLGKKAILSGEQRTYREGHDYDSMPLDWIDKGLQRDYIQAVTLITERRLASGNWPRISPDRIFVRWDRGVRYRQEIKSKMKAEWGSLPLNKRPTDFDNFWSKYGNARYFQFLSRKKVHHRYAGYETIIDISSGIYRQYLEICGHIVSKALARGWRPDSGTGISAEDQDDAIREYSRAMLDGLSITAGDTSALLSGKIEVTSKQMLTLVHSLLQLFSDRLHSNIREPEIFCIAIKDDLDANREAKTILDVAVRESILHRRQADYPPKTKGGPSLPTYMLNRRLAPIRTLGLRMQGRIEMSSRDVVLAARDTNAFTRKFSKGEKNGRQKKLFD